MSDKSHDTPPIDPNGEDESQLETVIADITHSTTDTAECARSTVFSGIREARRTSSLVVAATENTGFDPDEDIDGDANPVSGPNTQPGWAVGWCRPPLPDNEDDNTTVLDTPGAAQRVVRGNLKSTGEETDPSSDKDYANKRNYITDAQKDYAAPRSVETSARRSGRVGVPVNRYSPPPWAQRPPKKSTDKSIAEEEHWGAVNSWASGGFMENPMYVVVAIDTTLPHHQVHRITGQMNGPVPTNRIMHWRVELIPISPIVDNNGLFNRLETTPEAPCLCNYRVVLVGYYRITKLWGYKFALDADFCWKTT